MSTTKEAKPLMTRDEVIRSQAKHIRRVGELLVQCSSALALRAVVHDASKWSPEEWPLYEVATPKLAGLTYGSPEYRESLREIKPAITHHYENNSHHPEFFKDGVNGMTLLDVLEMLMDWKAAGERHDDGSIRASIEKNTERFALSPQLVVLMLNTARSMGWIE